MSIYCWIRSNISRRWNRSHSIQFMQIKHAVWNSISQNATHYRTLMSEHRKGFSSKTYPFSLVQAKQLAVLKNILDGAQECRCIPWAGISELCCWKYFLDSELLRNQSSLPKAYLCSKLRLDTKVHTGRLCAHNCRWWWKSLSEEALIRIMLFICLKGIFITKVSISPTI